LEGLFVRSVDLYMTLTEREREKFYWSWNKFSLAFLCFYLYWFDEIVTTLGMSSTNG